MREVLIVDPAAFVAEEEACQRLASLWDGAARVLRPALEPQSQLDHQADCFVLLGSRASVHDDLPWIHSLRRWLMPFLEGQVQRPLLAICFGHQLVGDTAGGEVGWRADDGSKLQGFINTEFTPNRLWPAGPHPILANHAEVLRSIPAGFERIAMRKSCAIDAMAHRELPIFSTQFHPEAGPEFCQHVGMDYRRAPHHFESANEAFIRAFFESCA